MTGDTIDRTVKVAFGKARGLHGSPRLHADLRDDGWTVSEKTVADSMRRQELVARRIKPGLVLRVLQPRPSTQRRGHDEPDQLREHRGPQPGSRIRKPSTFRGNHKIPAMCRSVANSPGGG